MAEVRSFCGTRYNGGAVGDLSRVVSPPYDVIQGNERSRLASLSPYNVVNLILPQSRDGMNEFQSSAAYIDQWLSEEVLVRDDEPCMYIYRHEFEADGRSLVRTGLIAALDLKGCGARVRRHEKTMSGPRENRLGLLEETHSFLGPIFMLYPDAGAEVRGMIGGAAASENVELNIEEERHTLSIVRDPAFHEGVSELLRPKTFIIADGHHRFESSLVNYQNGMDEEWRGGTLVFCVSMEDPGLMIGASHRMVKGLSGPLDTYLKKLGELADLEPVEDLEELLAGMSGAPEAVFGLCAGDGLFLVRCPRGGETVLDVEVLQGLLETLFSGDADGVEISYTNSVEEGAGKARNGEISMFFMLLAVVPEELIRICDMGRIMPPKATYFYPKPLTGLVMKIDR